MTCHGELSFKFSLWGGGVTPGEARWRRQGVGGVNRWREGEKMEGGEEFQGGTREGREVH